MKKKCEKCKDSLEGGAVFVEGGKSYNFCKLCSKILESYPKTGNIIPIFLKDDSEMTQVDKNMFEARKRRAKGETLWPKYFSHEY